MLFTSLLLLAGSAAQPNPDTALVQAHVKSAAAQTFRQPSGALKFPYLVPAGPYQESWDWDSCFMGVALRAYGATPYFVGTFMNFLSFVNLTDGALPGCLTPAGPSATLYHAKPLIIQAALLAARQAGNLSLFAEYGPQMRALLGYWNSSSRFDAATGLHLWHDQLETGADNLVFSQCPSQYSPECWSEAQAYTLASPDIMVWLVREYEAYATFLGAWRHSGGGGLNWAAEAAGASAYAARLRDVIHERLWRWLDAPANTRGLYVAFNVSTGSQIVRRTYQAAWPVWAGLAANESVKRAALTTLLEADLWSPFGLRSASSEDPRYNNDNIINPYSNWRGPIWVNVNALMAYTLRANGQEPAAGALADTIVRVLAEDLRAHGEWHEAYSSENGTALAAPGVSAPAAPSARARARIKQQHALRIAQTNTRPTHPQFLSWNTLGADLQANVAAGIDPFALA